MAYNPYIGELLAARAADIPGNPKYILGMLIEINDWDYDEKYTIQWFDDPDSQVCNYNENDYQVFRDRMVKVRQEYGL